MHRDIKSANIFLFTPQTQETTEINSQSQTDLLQQAKLGDMNVSKVSKQGMNRTQTGTPYYASPEVWRDEPYSFKSDIWSLGVVIYEMTSLIPPF
jgi:NIMA (never in mitosis gene a)-related kinase